MYDVFCYGAISLDISGRLERPVHEYEQATAIDYHMSPGGDAALVAMMLSSLGLEVTLAGSPVGEDPIGEQVVKSLEKEGVKVVVPRIGKTAITAIVLDRDKRSAITFHDVTPEEKIPIPDDSLRASRYAYVDGCFGRNSAIIAKVARANGIEAQLNVDLPSIQNIGLFSTTIASETVSRHISADPEEAARKMFSMNKGVAIVTLGENGCVCYSGKAIRVPAFKVEEVDTTGAGAAFAAGFIYAGLMGEPLEARLEFASAAGAIKAMARGSYVKLSEKGIADFIHSHIK
ncbi:carbohydrate kinase family protein [Methanocella conradii]|uniref:carbohydrate kinase family protein n=1 Tax=Methanocella conradii TaxID=1175444 RepID=UPI00157D2F39|nr:PfkB family carbohydrate kinase [Methanocella conradii]